MMWNNPIAPEGKILIEETVLSTIDSYRQINNKIHEAGGILLGYRRGYHLHVVDLTVPSNADRRTLFRFFRVDPSHQKTALKLWRSSQNTIDYLGEWHTHPEVYPNPSGIDLSEWRKICAAKNKPMIFLIAGIDENLWLGIGEVDRIISAGDFVDNK